MSFKVNSGGSSGSSGPSGSAAANQLTYWSASSTLAGSANMTVAASNGQLNLFGQGANASPLVVNMDGNASNQYKTGIELSNTDNSNSYPFYLNMLHRGYGKGMSVSSSADGWMHFNKHTSVGSTGTGTVAELFTMTDTGRLGVNATSPSYSLDVVGGAQVSINNGDNMRVDVSGNGLTSGISVLSTNADDTGQQVALLAVAASSGFRMLSDPTGGERRLKFQPWTGTFGSSVMTLYGYDGGYVGIQNDTPSQPLDVTGNIRATGAYINVNNVGVSGTFTTVDGKTVSVSGGIIYSIV